MSTKNNENNAIVALKAIHFLSSFHAYFPISHSIVISIFVNTH